MRPGWCLGTPLAEQSLLCAALPASGRIRASSTSWGHRAAARRRVHRSPDVVGAAGLDRRTSTSWAVAVDLYENRTPRSCAGSVLPHTNFGRPIERMITARRNS